MQQVSRTSLTCTDTTSAPPAPGTPGHADVRTLRSAGLPLEPLRITVPVKPRPAAPAPAADPERVASWWQHAEDFANGIELDHHTNRCFSDGAA